MSLVTQPNEAGPSPPRLRVSGVTKRYGAATALHAIDLTVRQGSFTAILGPSGCGKSTLLRLIAGFAEPTSGRIEIDGRDVTRLGPENRPTNMVFQGYGLFPHMTVTENVGFGLSIARRPRAEIDRRVSEALSLVRLEDFANRRIDALSGGQQQRVALARALIMQPLILLLDEPLAALDLKLRQTMQAELRRLHRETGGTFIFVTHDQSEAFSLADNLVVMNQGRIEQIGAPQHVYMRPNTLFVSQFVGDTNIVKGHRQAETVELEIGPRLPRSGPDGQAIFVLRPEAIRISVEPSAKAGVQATVDDVLLLGSEARITLLTTTGHQLVARFSDPRDGSVLQTGTTVTISWAPEALSEIDRAP